MLILNIECKCDRCSSKEESPTMTGRTFSFPDSPGPSLNEQIEWCAPTGWAWIEGNLYCARCMKDLREYLWNKAEIKVNGIS